MTRVLVTGHDGYIGAVLAPHLLSHGYAVRGLDTFLFGEDWFSPALQPVDAVWRDLRDVTPTDLAGVDAVIHLAALSNDPLGELAPEVTLEINHRASVRLAHAARTAGVRRFLYASSCSLYGIASDGVVDETSAVAPLTAYARSKALTEEALASLADDRFSPVVLRCATVFGSSPKLRLDLVVNNLVACGVTSGKIRMVSDGTPWRPLIHVEDLSRVYEALLRAPRAVVHNRTFNVGFNDQNHRVAEIAAAVASAVPGTRVSVGTGGDADQRSYRVRFDRLQQAIGIEPRWDLETGIWELAEAYRAAGLSPDALADPAFARVRRMTDLIETGQIDASLRWRRAKAA